MTAHMSAVSPAPGFGKYDNRTLWKGGGNEGLRLQRVYRGNCTFGKFRLKRVTKYGHFVPFWVF
jgi:hypothetical protein